jgi:hypothetical protein
MLTRGQNRGMPKGGPPGGGAVRGLCERPSVRGRVRQVDAELSAFTALPLTFSREKHSGSGATIASLRASILI